MGTDYSVDISLRLKEIRKVLGISRKKFAESLSLSQSHYSNVENGKRAVTIDLLQMLYLLYGVSADYVLFGRGDMFVDKGEEPKDIYAMTDLQKMSQMLQLYEYFVRYKSIVMDGTEIEIYEYFHELDRCMHLYYYKQLGKRTRITDKS